MIVYQAINKINGKIYIGQTIKSLEDRILMHMQDARRTNFIFHKAIKKYGIQSFEWSIIDIADCKEILDEKEIYWIGYLNSKVPNGYNLTDGGEGGSGALGHHHSEEAKRKIGLKHLGNKSFLGRHHSEDTLKKMRHPRNSNGRLGKHHSEETKRKIGNANRGKPGSNKERVFSNEWKRNISLSLQNHPVSEETSKKISITRRPINAY